uniref:Zgc:158432 n=1 Tax=Sinocyclocheilus rhinocerous TaxID=307959 RepID=A0A673MIJ2_9TELE
MFVFSEGITTSKTASKDLLKGRVSDTSLFCYSARISFLNHKKHSIRHFLSLTDLTGGQPPPNMRPVQQGHIPMTAMPNHPYNLSLKCHFDCLHSMYTGMRDPPMGGPVQPYSYGAVRGQIVSNPYARDSPSRNPYEEHSPSADHHSDYRPRVPSHTYDDLKHNQPYSPAPLYGSSEHGNLRNGFPRPQLSLRY